MVKRIWTIEQKEEIVTLFNEGYTFKDLQNKYKAHFNTIKKILSDNGINTNSKRRWTKEKKEDIVQKYTEESWTMTELQRLYKTNAREVRAILKEYGVDTEFYRNRVVNRSIYRDFFSTVDTEEKAYILGLLMADGCVREKRPGQPYLMLELIDLDMIEKVQKALNSDSKITKCHRDRDYIQNEQPTYTFSVADKQLCADLEKYGIIPWKTRKTERLPHNIPVELRRHYLRGIIDGDGSLGFYNNRWYITLTNNHYELLKDATEWISELTGLHRPKVSDTSTSKRIGYSGSSALKVITLLYKDNTISINRKQKLADQAFQDIV